MPDRTTDTGPKNGIVEWYVAAVAVAAVALTCLVYVLGHDIVPPSKGIYVAIFCVLLFIGESGPRLLRFVDGGQVTPGWAFAFGIVLLGSPIVAIAAMAGCTLYLDLRDHKSATKVVFNAAQITASLAAGALVLQLLGLRGAITDVGPLSVRWGIGILVSAALVFTANGLLTAIVLALHYRTSLRSIAGRSFLVSISADAALLALSPIFVVAIEYSLLMLPLLGVTAVLVYQSTQQALKRAHEANHDGLTHLLNRRTFDTNLTGYLESKSDDVHGAVLLMDLDGFKEINDQLGHQTGDMVLIGIADQLTKAAPDSAVIARVGGDEFAVLLPDVGSESETMAMVERLRAEFTRPIVVDGFPLSVGASVGMAFVATDGNTSEELLNAADAAMYRAKRNRTGVESYKAVRLQTSRGGLGLLGELSDAIAAEQLQVHYQPLTRFRDGTPKSMEALLRWHHPTLGHVPPGDFIALAEHTDLIVPLTQFVLTQSTVDARSVDQFDLRLSINVSARNLQDRRFPSSVLRALDEAALSAARLELEITETALANEPDRSLYVISAMREAGVRVSIDGFGTGNSSFSMLRDLTVDRLKIDSMFVKGIANSSRQQHLVKAMVSLARGLGIETVAKGVESEESWEILSELGCDVAQGFLISRPLPMPDLVEWLDVRHPLSTLDQVS
ncbi:MAG: putative bifunctional diguanylate cyclase/phosphodiesterase [Ilumatobacteraceae bacterium]